MLPGAVATFAFVASRTPSPSTGGALVRVQAIGGAAEETVRHEELLGRFFGVGKEEIRQATEEEIGPPARRSALRCRA